MLSISLLICVTIRGLAMAVGLAVVLPTMAVGLAVMLHHALAVPF